MSWWAIALYVILAFYVIVAVFFAGVDLIFKGKVQPATAKGLAAVALILLVVVLAILAVAGISSLAS